MKQNKILTIIFLLIIMSFLNGCQNNTSPIEDFKNKAKKINFQDELLLKYEFTHYTLKKKYNFTEIIKDNNQKLIFQIEEYLKVELLKNENNNIEVCIINDYEPLCENVTKIKKDSNLVSFLNMFNFDKLILKFNKKINSTQNVSVKKLENTDNKIDCYKYSIETKAENILPQTTIINNDKLLNNKSDVLINVCFDKKILAPITYELNVKNNTNYIKIFKYNLVKIKNKKISDFEFKFGISEKEAYEEIEQSLKKSEKITKKINSNLNLYYLKINGTNGINLYFRRGPGSDPINIKDLMFTVDIDNNKYVFKDKTLDPNNYFEYKFINNKSKDTRVFTQNDYLMIILKLDKKISEKDLNESNIYVDKLENGIKDFNIFTLK